MTENHFLGIDFGNNFSSVGTWIDGRVEILSNGGFQTIPSCVLYKNEEILVGHSAWRHLVMNATNTIYDLKRLIGKPNIDVLATNSLKYWPFKFFYDEQSLPTVEITIKEDKLKKKPDEVAGKIFEKLKEASPSTDIVMSMPAFFDDGQKQSLKEAAKVAGLNVVEFISDPTAALYAYVHEFGVKNSANLLIFDFGGSKCDVMVAHIDGGQANVLAVGGDLFLGGRDIDHLLMDYFAEKIKNKHEKDVFENAKTRQRLLKECIELKHTLTNMNESGLFVSELFPGIEDEVIIDIETFNTLCQPLFYKIEQLLNGTLKTADLKSSEIQEVVIVGGSTRIPRVKEILHQNFPHAKLSNALHPEEAIAYGATVRAAQLCELTQEKALKFIVNDNDAKRFCLEIFKVENQSEVENQEKEENEMKNQEKEHEVENQEKEETNEATNTTNDDRTTDIEPRPKPPPRKIESKNEDEIINKELKENNQPSFSDKRRETLYQEVQKWIRRLYNCNRIPYTKLTDFETKYSALKIENVSNGELTLLRSNAYQEFRNMILQNEIVRQMEQLEVEINKVILIRLKSELLSDIRTLLDDVLQQDDEYKSGDTFRIHAQKIQAKLLSETNVFESNETIHRFKKLLQEPRDH